MTNKAVIIDLDGTLLNDRKQVGEKDLKCLHTLGQKGILRIIATGRSLYSFNEVIAEDFPIDYLIFNAGGGTFNFKTKEIKQSYFIEKKDILNIVKLLDKLKLDYQIRSKIPNSHKYLYKQYSKENHDFDRINSLYKDHIKVLNDYNEIDDSARIIIIAQNTEIVEIIENEFQLSSSFDDKASGESINKGFSIIRATSPIDHASVWMEIYPEGVNKGNAVKKLCREKTISLDHVTGIGNDYNDIHFLDIVNRSYIVSNAAEELKQKYEVICSNNENPLSFVIQNYLY